MAWVRIDDEFYDHPKWASAPGDSIALWIAAMAWCNRNHSWDGYIPAVKLAGLVNVRNARATVADLVKRRAFDGHDEGFLIHDYGDYQETEKTRLVREERSKIRSEAGKRGAESRWRKGGKPDGKCHDEEWQTDGNQGSKPMAPPPTTQGLLNTPPTTTTSYCDLPSAAAVVEAIVEVEFEAARRRGIGDHPARYRDGIQRRVQGDYGPALDAALEAEPLLTAHALGQAVLNGHPDRSLILMTLETS